MALLVLLAGCQEPAGLSRQERFDLYIPVLRMGDSIRYGNPHAADSLASVWLSERPRGGPSDPPTYTDTLTAYVLARQAHAQRLAGDTLQTVATYQRLLTYRHLLPDSTAARVLRAMAYRMSRANTREGLALLDVAERWARERGLRREAAEIMRCKAQLVERMEARDIVPAAVIVEPQGPPSAGLTLIALAALLAALGYALGRRKGAHDIAPSGAEA